jgi:hypothetical protein
VALECTVSALGNLLLGKGGATMDLVQVPHN